MINLNNGQQKKITFASTCGMSPAVVSESLWALAQEGIFPDDIYLFTTQTGCDIFKKQLLDTNIWQEFKKDCAVPENKLRFGTASVKLCPNSALDNSEDIRSSEDNGHFADFLLRELRALTADQNTQLIFSIAGGRKTMSATGALVFSLVARPNDRLCHVLVNSPFDNPSLQPTFFYPKAGQSHSYPERGSGQIKEILAEEAIVELADTPVILLRDLFKEKFNSLAQNYCHVVAGVNARTAGTDQREMALLFDDKKIVCHEREFTLQTQLFNGLYLMLKATSEGYNIRWGDDCGPSMKKYLEESGCSDITLIDNVRGFAKQQCSRLGKEIDRLARKEPAMALLRPARQKKGGVNCAAFSDELDLAKIRLQ